MSCDRPLLPVAFLLILYKIRKNGSPYELPLCVEAGGAVGTAVRAFFIFVERRLLLIDPVPSARPSVRFRINNKAKPAPCPVVSSG